ncbi:MAG TPA: hypothetical protein VJ063_15205 [Verrucomicrobiae bacterium]|nr:hypothetical protein [Verrucomicrobiae bacterium]
MVSVSLALAYISLRKKLLFPGFKIGFLSEMRRVEIINAAERIVSALQRTQLRQNMAMAPRGAADNAARSIFAYHQFALLAANFGEPEKEMLRRLGLGLLLEDEKMMAAIIGEQQAALRDVIRGTLYATQFLPRFVELLEPDYLRGILEKKSDLPTVLADKTALTVLAIEDKRQFSPPRRIIEIIDSISLMYDAVAMLNGESSDDLILLTCDSGSDKSFDFLGAAKLVEQVKELILSLWDKVVFFREKQAAERIELVAKSLPIIEKIEAMRQALGPEKAEIIKRKVVDGAEKFLNNGATIPEIMNVSSFNSRALLAPTRKLLMESAPLKVEPAVPNPPLIATPEDNLTAAEQAQLRQLMEKMMKGNATPPSGEVTEDATEHDNASDE